MIRPTKGGEVTCHTPPRAAYAAMVTGMDRNLGRIFDAVKARGEWDNTIVIFTSDNGETFELGVFDPDFFGSNRGLRGSKCGCMKVVCGCP